MKQAITLLAGITMFITGLAQTDSTKKEGDTIRVGDMIISTETDKNDKKDRSRHQCTGAQSQKETIPFNHKLVGSRPWLCQLFR